MRATNGRPKIQLVIVRQVPGLYLATLRVSRASIPNGPALCTGNPPTTVLDTAFVIDDGADPLVTVAGTIEWTCSTTTHELRVTTSNGPTTTPAPTRTPAPTATGTPRSTATPAPTPTTPTPTPTPTAPAPTPTQIVSNTLKASVRINLLTRQTGQPSLVQLDGSHSTDSTGTIVTYTFSVARKSDGSLVYGPTASAQTQVTTTIAPGDYNAILTVTDNNNATSAPDTRGFSVK